MKSQRKKILQKHEIPKTEYKDLVFYIVEGSTYDELNKFLKQYGVNLKDLIWLGNTRDPIGKVFYNSKNKLKLSFSEREIQEYRDLLNPLSPNFCKMKNLPTA